MARKARKTKAEATPAAPPVPQVPEGEWVLLGSGPSGRRVGEFEHGRKVACVNGSYPLLDRVPDAYGMFEFSAWEQYGPQYVAFAKAGAQCVTRPDVIEHKRAPGSSVGFLLGWDQTRMPRAGESYPGMLNSGVCMLLWLILKAEPKPTAIHVLGMDGYDPAAMYAEGVRVYAGMRDADWCARQNALQKGHLRRLAALAAARGITLVFHGAMKP